MKRTSIGGQAVLEGVMMRAPEGIAVAVRSGEEIVKKFEKHVPLSKRNKFFGLPIVRGVVSFVESLTIGMKTLTYSADVLGMEEEEKPSKFEEYIAKKTGKDAMKVMMGFAVVIAIALAIGIFFILPNVLANLVRPLVSSALLMNLLEGVTRLLIFFTYIVCISAMKDIRRVFMYHGAEHKVIACFEADEELTVANAREKTCLHPRCGTNYLFLVMMVSIVFFSFFGWSGNPFLRMLIRIAFIPVVAGLAYEVLKLAAKSDNILCRAVRFPGLMLQKLTTREPEDGMIEVALAAFELAVNGVEVQPEVPSDNAAKEKNGETSDSAAIEVPETPHTAISGNDIADGDIG